MKTIVVAGSRSGCGKTALTVAMQRSLEGKKVTRIKIGTGEARPENPQLLFHGVDEALCFIRDAAARPGTDVLIIESNSILSRMVPDLCVFIEAPDSAMKETAFGAKEKSDIVIGGSFDRNAAGEKLAAKWGSGELLGPLAAQHEYLYGR